MVSLNFQFDHTFYLASQILSPVDQLDYMLENTPRCGEGMLAWVVVGVEKGGT